MKLNHEELKIVLIQMRESQKMIDHEIACILRAGKLQTHQLTLVDVLKEPLSEELLQGHHAVFIGGTGDYGVGSDRPEWFQSLCDFTLRLYELSFPLLGLCYGFHVMAHAHGGEVKTRPDLEETGTFDIFLTQEGQEDVLLAGQDSPFPAQQGHHDVVLSCPDYFRCLAKSELCPWQAFALDGVPQYGFQFHPELTDEDFLLRMREYAFSYANSPEIFEAIASKTRKTDNDIFIEHYLTKVVIPYWESQKG